MKLTITMTLMLALGIAAGAQTAPKRAPQAAAHATQAAQAPIKIPDAAALQLRTLELRMSRDQQQITASQADQAEAREAAGALLQKEEAALRVDPEKYRLDDATLSFLPDSSDPKK